MCKKLICLSFFILVLGLAQGQAWGQSDWDRVAYWDARYPAAWSGGGQTVRDGLEAAGYPILDADELKTWMDARIADGALSVVVFCQDVAPDTVAETMSDTCTLRRYLDAGGKVVWYSDWPFYYQGSSDGTMTTWAVPGAVNVLGFDAATGPGDTYEEVALTAAGVSWGLTETWQSRRPTSATVTENLTVLATLSGGSAAAWVKHYVPGDNYRGFVRIYDRDGQANVDDIIRVAEYMGTKASNPYPADGAIHPDVWASLAWSAGAFAESHDVYFGENFDDVDAGTGGTFLDNVPEDNVTDPYLIVGFPGYPYPGGFVPGTTYYWRVDEVDPTNTYKGDVWSFFVPPKKAFEPSPADGAEFIETDVTLTWTAGFGTITHTVYFGEDFDTVSNATVGTGAGTTAYTPPDPLEPGKTYYWRVDEADMFGTYKGDVWSFTTLPEFAITDPNLLGWWKLDEGSGVIVLDGSGHGNHGTIMGDPQWVIGHDGGALEFDGSSAYVDCGNAEALNVDVFSVSFWCNIPSTQGYNHMVSRGSHASASAVNWGVMMHSGEQRILFESFNDTTWPGIRADTTIGEWHHVVATYDGDTMQLYHDGALAETTSGAGMLLDQSRPFLIGARSDAGTANAFFNGSIDDVRIYNKVLTQDEVEQAMQGDPTLAWGPSPANRSKPDIYSATSLSWSPGEKAAQHDVYFGTDEDAVDDADTTTANIYRGRQAATSYSPPEGVEWGGGPYYWRIDQYNTDATISKGRVWSFTVADYLVVDDIEQYDIQNAIWANWHDGLGYITTQGVTYPGNGTGAEIGDPSTGSYTEETIVHSGGKSMPYWYNNNKPDKWKYSEAKLTLSHTRNWTEENVKALSLWFYGDPANAAEQMYLAVANNAGPPAVVEYAGDADDLKKAGWQEWNIDLREFTGINLTDVNSIAIGFGDRNSPQIGGSGKMYFDDIRLYRARCVPSILKPDADLSGNCVVDMADIEMIAADWLATDSSIAATAPSSPPVGWWKFDNNTNESAGNNHGIANGFPSYATGMDGQAISLDGVDDYVSVAGVGISGAAPRTIAGWAKANATEMNDWTNVFGFTGPSGNGGHFDIEYVGNTDSSTHGYYGV
ncbi:MAG: LamG domain-containing protein, partial [Phycisphaerales bacterium]